MRLAQSKPDHAYGRHLVLSCTREEASDVRAVILSEILDGKTVPVTEVVGTGEERRVLFRMHLRYLDMLTLAFPMADLSPVLGGKMRKAEEKRLSDMEVPALWIPGMRRSIRSRLTDYQRIAIGRIMDGTIDLLNDEMGLGKTVSCLAALRKLEAFPALVVAPNSALDEWADQIQEHFRDITFAIVGGPKQQRQEAVWQEADITLVNYEGIRAKAVRDGEGSRSKIVGWEYSTPALFERKYKFAVLDEHHRVKNPYAQTTQGFFQLEAERWLYMSGTPLLNRPEEIWPVLHKSYPDEFQSYEDFRKTICISRKGASGDFVIGYRPKPLKELREFLHKISLRRRKDQVLDQLPKVVTVKHKVPLSEEQRKLYDEIKEDLVLRLEDGSIRGIFGALPQLTRLKQACFSPELYGGSTRSAKVDKVKEVVEMLVENGEKAIIFSQWSKATRILERELAQYNPAYVDGSVPRQGPGGSHPRRDQAKKFMEDPDCKIYIGTIGANREAINLGVASYVIFTDLDWTPAAMDQAVGRSAAGGLRGLNIREGLKVHVIEIQAENTVEARIDGILKRKRNLTARTVDRDGGKKYEPVSLSDLKDII